MYVSLSVCVFVCLFHHHAAMLQSLIVTLYLILSFAHLLFSCESEHVFVIDNELNNNVHKSNTTLYSVRHQYMHTQNRTKSHKEAKKMKEELQQQQSQPNSVLCVFFLFYFAHCGCCYYVDILTYKNLKQTSFW